LVDLDFVFACAGWTSCNPLRRIAAERIADVDRSRIDRSRITRCRVDNGGGRIGVPGSVTFVFAI